MNFAAFLHKSVLFYTAHLIYSIGQNKALQENFYTQTGKIKCAEVRACQIGTFSGGEKQKSRFLTLIVVLTCTARLLHDTSRKRTLEIRAELTRYIGL